MPDVAKGFTVCATFWGDDSYGECKNATPSEGRPQIHHEYGKLEEKKDKKLTTSLSHFFGPWPAGVLSQADKKQAGDTPSRKSLISPGQE